MADNTLLNSGTGGDTIATDDIGGVKHQRVKVQFGADGSATDVSSAAPLPIDDAGGSLTVDGTVSVSGTVTVDGSGVTQPVSAAALPLPSGAATSVNQLADGHNVTIDNVSGASAVNIQDGGNSITIDSADLVTLAGAVSGTEMQVDVLNLPASTSTIEMVGDVADDAASAGNPVLVGGVAIETDGTDPGEVSAEADAAFLRTDLNRRLLVNSAHPNLFSASSDFATAQTNATVQAAPGAGLSLYITDILISNGATAGNVTLLDGSGGTVLLELYPAIGGGATLNMRTPIRLTANTLLAITSTGVTTHSVTVSGYRAP